MITTSKSALCLLALALMASGVACSASDDTTSPESSSATTEEDLRVCAPGSVVHGVDVSTYQGAVDWTAVKKAGRRFAIARVSDGTGHVDGRFAHNWTGIRSAGLVRGVYQFFRPGQDPIAQANILLSRVNAHGGFKGGDIAPVLDLEVTDGVSHATLRARAHKWLTHVEAVTGLKPIVYTAAFMSSALGSTFSKYPLWVANYGVTCPTLPSSWAHWKMWQNSSTGHVSGISGGVDVDQFNGTLAGLLAFTVQPQQAPAVSPAGTVSAGEVGAGTASPSGAAAGANDAADESEDDGAADVADDLGAPLQEREEGGAMGDGLSAAAAAASAPAGR